MRNLKALVLFMLLLPSSALGQVGTPGESPVGSEDTASLGPADVGGLADVTQSPGDPANGTTGVADGAAGPPGAAAGPAAAAVGQPSGAVGQPSAAAGPPSVAAVQTVAAERPVVQAVEPLGLLAVGAGLMALRMFRGRRG